MSDDEITRWMTEAQGGDDAAAQKLWEAYSEKLLRYAKKKLACMPRRAVDEEDVIVSAMNSYFAAAKTGQLAPENRNELWKLLTTITVRKANAQIRRHYAQKRGGGVVRGESVFLDRMATDQEHYGINQVIDDRNLDVMSGQLIQMCEEKLTMLNDDSLREVAILRLEGYSNDEMAEQLHCSRATIKRKLARIREKWSDNRDLHPSE